jgi:hypothetical protein
LLNYVLDRLGISLSILCLIHCLLFPLIVLVLPALGATLFFNETMVHWVLLGMAFPVSLAAFSHGYRFHGDWMTLVIGALGLIFLIVGVSHWLGHDSEIYLTVPGAFLLFMAHLRNWRHHHLGSQKSKRQQMHQGPLEQGISGES